MSVNESFNVLADHLPNFALALASILARSAGEANRAAIAFARTA